MIIDSHAHYNNSAFAKGNLPDLCVQFVQLCRVTRAYKKPFRYLSYDKVGYSLILPAVLKRIAESKGISPAEVEKPTTENAIRLFSLPIVEDVQ